MRAILLEPDAGGRISGGYLYNARMAEAGTAIERRAVRPDHFEADLRALDVPDDAWLIADSLFLTAEHMAVFEQLFRGSRRRRAVLLHSLPSFIQCAEDRARLAAALPLVPPRGEVEMLESLDLAIAPGPYLPRLLARAGSRVMTAICPPGVDRAPPLSVRADAGAPVRLISIGSVTPLKGFLDAAEALGSLGSADFHWTVLGHSGVAPEYVERLRRRSIELGIGDRVALDGQRSHAETLAALRQSDLLLITSFTENHPLVALEALAACVPVVGYAVGGLPDIVRHGETGSLSPMLDIRHLSVQLSRLVADRSARMRLAEGCARAAATLPSWAQAAQRFVEALEQHS